MELIKNVKELKDNNVNPLNNEIDRYKPYQDRLKKTLLKKHGNIQQTN